MGAEIVGVDVSGELDGSTFERFLAAGRVVLMLDGFDEVASSVAAGSGEAVQGFFPLFFVLLEDATGLFARKKKKAAAASSNHGGSSHA